MSNKPQLRMINSRGLKTSWLEFAQNNKPILLLLHGYPDNPYIWQKQFEALASNYYIIAPFNRGVCHSEPSNKSSRYGLNSLSLDVLEILKTIDPLQKQKIYIIGHDLGGTLAWWLADILKNRVESLIIVNSLSIHQARNRIFKNPKQLLKSYYMLFLISPLAPIFLRKKGFETLKKIYQENKIDPTECLKNYDFSQLLEPRKQYREFLKSVFTNFNNHPKKITAKTLIISSFDDPYILTPKKSEFSNECPHAIVRLLQGKHWLHFESYENLNEIFLDFMQDEKSSNIESNYRDLDLVPA